MCIVFNTVLAFNKTSASYLAVYLSICIKTRKLLTRAGEACFWQVVCFVKHGFKPAAEFFVNAYRFAPSLIMRSGEAFKKR